MAESLFPANLQKALECAVCLSLFDTPKVLPCGHSFCAACVDGLVTAGGQLTCPECRRTSAVTFDGLPTNLAAAAAASEVLAKQEAARNRCKQCERRLTAEEAFVCTDCDDTLICWRCAFAAHNGHRLIELPAAIELNQSKVDRWKNQNASDRQMLMEKQDFLRRRQAELERVIDRLTAILQATQADAAHGAHLVDSCNTLLAACERVDGSEEVYIEQQGDMKVLTAAAVALQNDLSQASIDINQVITDGAVLSGRVEELRHVLGGCEHIFQPTDLEVETSQLKMTADSLRAELEEARAQTRAADEQSAALREQLQSQAAGGDAAAGCDVTFEVLPACSTVEPSWTGQVHAHGDVGGPPVRHHEPIPRPPRGNARRARASTRRTSRAKTVRDLYNDWW